MKAETTEISAPTLRYAANMARNLAAQWEGCPARIVGQERANALRNFAKYLEEIADVS